MRSKSRPRDVARLADFVAANDAAELVFALLGLAEGGGRGVVIHGEADAFGEEESEHMSKRIMQTRLYIRIERAEIRWRAEWGKAAHHNRPLTPFGVLKLFGACVGPGSSAAFIAF